METKLIQYFNNYINNGFYSAYLYYAMSTYFCEIAMFGFCDFMKKKASEKLLTSQQLYSYLILRDEKLSFSKIDEPSIDWINVSDVFSIALSHEEFMLSQINQLYKVALEENDFATVEFISTILDKQVASLSTLRRVVFRIKNTNIVSTSVELIDGMINQMSLN